MLETAFFYLFGGLAIFAALGVILAALWAMARRRYWLLGVLSAMFALTYVAVHAYVGMCWIVVVWLAWANRRFEWKLLYGIPLCVTYGYCPEMLRPGVVGGHEIFVYVKGAVY